MSEAKKQEAGRRRPRVRLPLWAAAAAVVLIAVNLRPGATSVGPVLAELQSSLGMGSAMAGVLTALPGLIFAVVGAVAVALSRRAGINGTIAAGAAIVAAGLLLRSVVDSPVPFLLLTALAFAGMAVGNILVPAFIKRHGGERTALLNSVYGTTLAVGATLPLLIAAPLAASGPDGWQVSIRVWGAVALVAVVPWTVLAFRGRRSRTESAGTAGLVSDGGTAGLAPDGGTAGLAPDSGRLRLTSSRTAVALCVYFGVQSMNAYVQFGWVAQIYRDAGLSQTQAGFMMAIIASLGIPGGLIMPALVARAPGLRFYVAGLAAASGAGYLGLLLAPDTVPWLWALLLGAGGFAFPTSLALITGRSRDPRVTAELSGFCQPVGYLLAAIGPFAIGALHAATESWTLPLAILIGASVAMAVAGMAAAAPHFVDDQLNRNPAQGG